MTSGPVFGQFNLVVRDMDATIAFYRRLGVTIRDTDPKWDPHHRSAVMPNGADLDFDSVAFAHQWDEGWIDGRMGVLGFEVESRDGVDATYQDLVDAGYRSEQPPYDAFWGARYAVVQDPDGNPVGIMSPIDTARKSTVEPPS